MEERHQAKVEAFLRDAVRKSPRLRLILDARIRWRFAVAEETIGTGPAIGVAISVSRAAEPQARTYSAANLPDVGKLVSFALPTGPGQQNVAGGAHAAALAEQIFNHLRSLKANDPDAVVHIFAALPKQSSVLPRPEHQGIAPCIVYEFDFDRRGNKTYQPSFVNGVGRAQPV